MKIQICDKNANKINALLDNVNGKARAHTFRHYYDIADQVDQLERFLTQQLNLSKSRHNGISATIESGTILPSGYRYSAQNTQIELYRGSRAWFLTSVARSDLYPNQVPYFKVYLTPAHDAYLVNQLHKSYSVKAADTHAERIGLALAKLLDLRTNDAGRYDTSIGDKTAKGLHDTIKAVLNDTPDQPRYNELFEI